MTTTEAPKKKEDWHPTHLMMRHPRHAGDRNFEVTQTKDDGNGAGEYKDAKGKKITVRATPLSPNPKDNKPDAQELLEVTDDGRKGVVTVLRIIAAA